MKIREALTWGAKELRNSKSSALDAEVLLVFVLKEDRTWLFSHLNNDLSSKLTNKYKKLISRRRKGEPIAYIIHHKEFYGLDFYVDENVLIPRPETELLVEETIKCHSDQTRRISRDPSALPQDDTTNILDVGTGSGCIAVALAKNLQAKLYATDISQKALKIARKNAEKYKLLSSIKFIKSDLFQNIPRLKFDLICVNLPYLWEDLPNYEPEMALNGGKDGLAIINKFLWQAKNYLHKDAAIIFEIDPRQRKSILKIAKNIYPDKKILLKKDLAGLDRVVIIR